MNKQPYDKNHLQEYTGILTSDDTRGERFKMELKAEDNPVMERWTQKGKSTIELEFRYNLGPSTMFFHNMHTCPNNLQRVDCNECERMRKMYDVFVSNLYALHFGDTFKIKAALINNDESVLPAEIHGFENYQPLWVACTANQLRLDDTPEGIKKKYEREQQRLQQEREAKEKRIEEEEKRKEDEEQARKDAKWRKRKQTFQQFPYISQIIVSVIGGVIAGIILTTIVEPIPRLFKYLYHLIFPD